MKTKTTLTPLDGSIHLKYLESVLADPEIKPSDIKKLRDRPDVLEHFKGLYNALLQNIAYLLEMRANYLIPQEEYINFPRGKIKLIKGETHTFSFDELSDYGRNASTFSELYISLGIVSTPFSLEEINSKASFGVAKEVNLSEFILPHVIFMSSVVDIEPSPKKFKSANCHKKSVSPFLIPEDILVKHLNFFAAPPSNKETAANTLRNALPDDLCLVDRTCRDIVVRNYSGSSRVSLSHEIHELSFEAKKSIYTVSLMLNVSKKARNKFFTYKDFNPMIKDPPAGEYVLTIPGSFYDYSNEELSKQGSKRIYLQQLTFKVRISFGMVFIKADLYLKQKSLTGRVRLTCVEKPLKNYNRIEVNAASFSSEISGLEAVYLGLL